MIARGSRKRSGITLTEILIAILIMGVGLISLATLFPLGLIRLREAARNSRSGLAFETASDDMDARTLLDKSGFRRTWYWYPVGSARVPRDPFVQDAAPNGTITGVIASDPSSTNAVGLLSGLPVCYDPLWRSITGVFPNVDVYDTSLDYDASYASQPANEARFGDGILGGARPYLRNDPDPENVSTVPSAHGLQRITNFLPWSSAGLTTQYPFTCLNQALLASNTAQPPDVSGDVFTSIDDIVFNPAGRGNSALSSVLPDLSVGNAPQADYKYTWFFTGRQLDAGGNGTQFVGEIVVCDSRPFGFDPLPPPHTNTNAPTGETVVEAIFGVAGTSVVPLGTTAPLSNFGYAPSDRTVMLRWPRTLADPKVRVGGWICDVTYERSTSVFSTRSPNTNSVFARCHWYQVTRRTDAENETATSSAPRDPGNYRRMILTIGSPLKVKTLLNVSNGSPVHLNVALVMPSVINVFPRSFEVH